jgi:mannose-6-phosphate isomerase-like protein (cupin superfamily)
MSTDTGSRPPQKFVVSHLRDADFTSGLRDSTAYRDLGIAAATHGLVRAHTTRQRPEIAFEEYAMPRHYHVVQFQLVYCLKGWIRTEFEGHGVHELRKGSCWVQPPGIKHKVLGRSDDFEAIEVIMPADFDTVNVE